MNEQEVIAELRRRAESAELSPELGERLRNLPSPTAQSAATGRQRTGRWIAASGIAAAVAAVALVSTLVITTRGADVSAPPPTPSGQTSTASSSVTYTGESSGPYQGYRRSVIIADYAHRYNSVGEMGQVADLIVLGRIDGRESITGNDDEGTASTHWNMSVEQAWKASGPAPRSIVVVQTGAINEAAKTMSEVIDDPLYQVGDVMVLFLRANTTGTYTVLAGHQGRFMVDDGLVSAFGGFPGVSKNTPLADFRTQVDRALNTPLFDASYYCGRPWTVPSGTMMMRFQVNWTSRIYNNEAVRPTAIVGNDTDSVISGVRGVWVVLQKPNGVVVATLPITDLLPESGRTYEIRGLVSKRITIPAATTCGRGSSSPLATGKYRATMVIELAGGAVATSGTADMTVAEA